jgi:hypothetical protein
MDDYQRPRVPRRHPQFNELSPHQAAGSHIGCAAQIRDIGFQLNLVTILAASSREFQVKVISCNSLK